MWWSFRSVDMSRTKEGEGGFHGEWGIEVATADGRTTMCVREAANWSATTQRNTNVECCITATPSLPKKLDVGIYIYHNHIFVVKSVTLVLKGTLARSRFLSVGGTLIRHQWNCMAGELDRGETSQGRPVGDSAGEGRRVGHGIKGDASVDCKQFSRIALLKTVLQLLTFSANRSARGKFVS